jgi:dTDP-glucose 4,6-dehydratase
MKTVLVTGGAGFIGSNFIRHIFHKYPEYKIIVLDALTYAGNIENIPVEIRDSGRFEFWYGNLNNLDLVDDLVEGLR